jgi:hypothetical protein
MVKGRVCRLKLISTGRAGGPRGACYRVEGNLVYRPSLASFPTASKGRTIRLSRLTERLRYTVLKGFQQYKAP